MQRAGKILVEVLTVMMACSCGGNSQEEEPQQRKFPYPTVPAAISDAQSQADYFAGHYWKQYFSDRSGIDSLELDQALANYIAMLQNMPLPSAQGHIADLHSEIEAAQRSEPQSDIYRSLTEKFSLYLYDTQSPLRDEDLYLPFVTAMASSEFTPEEERPSLLNTVKMCSLNRHGTPAADFSYRTLDGRDHKLYGIDADYVILFFTNPGCAACKDIRAELESDMYVDGLIGQGSIAVLNVFIDRDLQSWRENLPNYPDNWINGYDPTFRIKDDTIYSIRAIPSIYLLDGDKNVLLKDAEMGRLINYIKRNI